MKNNDQIKEKPYDPRQDPNSGLNFLLKEKGMMEAKGLTEKKQYLNLCQIIQENLRRYQEHE